jgi:Peptidase family M28/PDZ domain
VSRRHVAPLLTAFLLLCATGVFARAAVVPPSSEQLAEVVNALTAPDMEGRRSGTAGGDRAARQIAEWLAAAGLKPGGAPGSFLDTFVIETSSRPGPASSLELSGPSPRKLETGRDWIPHGGSLAGEVAGEVVFVGYGADLPDRGYDDYATVDVRGRIALALDGVPAHLADARVSRLDKLIAARRRGAGALLLVSDELVPLGRTAVRVSLVSGALTREAADAMLTAAGRTTAEASKALSTAQAPASFATGARVRIRVDLMSDEVRGANVVGILPGTDPSLAGEAVVIGAHYDHLGRVDGVVYPGADDNASGTAVALGLARAFAAAGGTARTLVVALFGAEELGLIGSGHYVGRPPVPLAQTVAMVNFDMVGRLRGRLEVGGDDSGRGLRAIVSEASKREGITADLQASPYGPSDHSRFYNAGVPVLFFHTGGHPDYHRPTDTADKIDADGMARVAAVAARVIERLATDLRPVYAKVPQPARRSDAASPGGAFFGISAPPRGADGLRLASVMPGTAAAKAGLREGDVIVRFAGTSVEGFEDFRSMVRERRPGDTVSVLYLRDGEAHTTSATLGTRVD